MIVGGESEEEINSSSDWTVGVYSKLKPLTYDHFSILWILNENIFFFSELNWATEGQNVHVILLLFASLKKHSVAAFSV